MNQNHQAGIVAENIHKSFGETRALAGVNLEVKTGEVFGLLGPNGAGKTTLVRVLTTLLKPDSGQAWVGGLDVVAENRQVRPLIGLAGQYAAVDEELTGRENLELVGRLYHLNRNQVRQTAQALLQQFDLLSAADRPVKTYSGGMRRRLDLAASLVGAPKILFLDEPTAGLDPRSRLELWKIIEQLARDGTTILLTTQYLEEADRLADTIAVLNYGKIIAAGTPQELKNQIGGNRLEIHLQNRSQTEATAKLLSSVASGKIFSEAETGRIVIPVTDGSQALTSAIRLLDQNQIAIQDIALHSPTLDDVFLSLT